MRRPLAAVLILAVAAQAVEAAPAPRPTHAQQTLQRQAQVSRAAAARLRGQIAQLQAQLVQLGAVEAGGERAAGDKKARLAQLNAQESALQGRIGARQAAVARLIGALELYRRNPPPAFLVHPASAVDAVRAQILARAIAPQLEAESRALAAQVEEVRRLRRVVEAASDDLFKSESELADQRARIEALIDQKTGLERQLESGGGAAEAALRALADKAGAPGPLIASLPPSPAAGGAAPAGFTAPVQGELITHFGQQTDKGRAEGITWRAAPGAPVLAPAAGTVEYAGPLKGYGVVLILAVGGAYHLVLAGLQAASGTTGQTVAAGEPIGRMADDAASPTDLYLEVRRDGEPVDPARWLRALRR
jgi:septal ring factor EnvC (AmiA/AmiB activator)